jgi:hypothetical protein
MRRFRLGDVGVRFLASLALVLATYNPGGYSYVGWGTQNFPRVLPLQAVLGIALLGFWIFFAHATWRSLGAVGVVLGLAFSAAVIWMVSSWGWLSVSNHGALAWVILFVVACLLTLGLCWASIRFRVSGQAVVEEVDR